jgi:hypothetical protein
LKFGANSVLIYGVDRSTGKHSGIHRATIVRR